MRPAAFIAAMLAVACATGGGVARAEEAASENEAEAKRLAARAQVHFDLGEYGLAIVDYREAYRLHPAPGLLYNLGQAYRLSGDCVSATVMYRNYLRLARRSPHRSVARQHISALAECNRKHTGWTEVDETFVGAAHGTAAAKEKRTASLVIAGATDRQSDGGEPRPGRRRKVAGVGFAGVGGALLLGGAYMMLRAESTADEVSRRYNDGAKWKDLEDLDRRGRREEISGATMLVAGGAALVTGATLYALGWREERQAATVSVVPGRKGAAVSVSWGF
jgi:hypothetical protein